MICLPYNTACIESMVAQWLAHRPLVLEVLGSIPTVVEQANVVSVLIFVPQETVVYKIYD